MNLEEGNSVIYIRGDVRLSGDVMYSPLPGQVTCWVYHRDEIGNILAAYRVTCDAATGAEITDNPEKGMVYKIDSPFKGQFMVAPNEPPDFMLQVGAVITPQGAAVIG